MKCNYLNSVNRCDSEDDKGVYHIYNITKILFLIVNNPLSTFHKISKSCTIQNCVFSYNFRGQYFWKELTILLNFPITIR